MTHTLLDLRRVAPVAGVLSLSLLLAACGGSNDDTAAQIPTPAAPVQVAFLPDIHFHDVYGTFQDGSFAGIPNSKSGRNATIRTMQAQMTSTRLFNENYFAFIAALDDAVAKGVKYIAMPGDFSDDGQPIHMRGLKKILDEYSTKHGIEFFAAPGNHDPVAPFDKAGGKSDFLGVDATTGRVGAARKIYSKGSDNCSDYTTPWAMKGETYCTEEIVQLGYAGITSTLNDHGFMPKPKYRYYETPYSTYAYKDYNFDTARTQAAWNKRVFEICKEGTGGKYKKDTYTLCKTIPDTSYLVEPVEGVWLLAIDANVYVPSGNGANDFSGSGDAGYNKMLTHKQHVIAWIKDVVTRGKAQGKQVIGFSHFPMSEFFNGASDDIISLLGTGKMQMVRRPAEDTTKALAQTGLQIHIGGHMHFNDTAIKKVDDTNTLFNIQAPSMAAYVPAYKLLTLKDATHVEVETIRMDNVPRFNELFEHYSAEHSYLTDFPGQVSGGVLWDKTILNATSYGDFSSRYMSELVRLRLLNDDWRCEMRELVKSPLTGSNLLVLSQLTTAVTLKELKNTGNRGLFSDAFYNCLSDAGGNSASNPAYATDYAAAESRARALALANGMRLEDFNAWKALDLAADFVRIANAGDLAFADIPAERAKQYKLLAQALQATNATLLMNGDSVTNANAVGALFQARFKPLMAILLKLAAGAPTRHFVLDLKASTLTDLTKEATPF